AAVAAVDEIAAHYVRLPFLRGHSAHLFVQRDRAAADLAMGATPRGTGDTLGGPAGRRRLRCACGGDLRLFLPDPGGASDLLERLAPPHVVRLLGDRARVTGRSRRKG